MSSAVRLCYLIIMVIGFIIPLATNAQSSVRTADPNPFANKMGDDLIKQYHSSNKKIDVMQK